MRKTMIVLAAVLTMNIFDCASDDGTSSLPAGDMPLVYDVEDTGADVTKPSMPAFSDLPSIPYESGGGGTISWRYSDMLEKRDNVEVENLLHAQGSNDEFPWYARALRQFNNDPDKLPFDHHELIAMIAPRAVLMIESS